MALDQGFGQDLHGTNASRLTCALQTCLLVVSGPGYLPTTNSHATVVELELPQGVAAGARQQSLDSPHAIRTKGIVA